MSEKNLDTHGRLRSKIVAFRMSPEEAELLDFMVSLSSMNKQDYIISKLNDRTINIVPSSRLQKSMEEAMLLIYRELLRIVDAREINPELTVITERLAAIFAGLEENELTTRLASDESVITGLERGA